MFFKFKNIIFLDVVSNLLYQYLIKYLSPLNLNYLWNFGFLSGIFLAIQIVTGFFLTMYYTPHIDFAFQSVEHIMRDVSNGWFIRYAHSNGASFFFLVVYIHIARGLYYNSYTYPRSVLWYSGVLIYFLMMATAFLGYVLPWGQMSYWAATVITNFLTVLPWIGKEIVYWVWGGFSINNATLNRFFSLHYILPFVILLLVLYHIYVLHQTSSSNPVGLKLYKMDKITFYPFYIIKDLYGILIVFIPFFSFVFFFPEVLSHSDNYIPANPLVTPAHIVPEWYFLPFYGILRSILDKTYGLVVMFISILALVLLPMLDKSYIKGNVFKPFNRIFFWLFCANFLFLGFLGSQTPTFPYIELGLFCTHFHLLYFFLFLPVITIFELGFFYKLPIRIYDIKIKKRY